MNKKVKKSENVNQKTNEYPTLYEKVRDGLNTSQIKDMENIEILEATCVNSYDFLAKVKIENKLYLAYLAHDRFRLTPID